MKPLVLELTAFGPYEKKTVIDFTRFGNSLFLITGKTGSGKTTIYDGIMYALFGDTSGAERKAENFRTQSISDKVHTIVSLSFEHKGVEYQVERVILPKSKKAVLYIPHSTPVEGLEAVNKKIEEILGIGKAQFRGIVMLAQGKFRELLTADSKNRSDILRKIFDTHLFSGFQQRIDAKLKALNEKVGLINQSIVSHISHLSCPEEYESLYSFIESAVSEEPDVLISHLDEMFEDLDKLADDDGHQSERLTIEISADEASLDELKRKITEGQINNKTLSDYDDAKKELEELKSQKDKYKELEESAKRSRKALKVQEKEEALEKLQKDMEDLRITIDENTAVIQESTPNRDALITEIASLEANPEREELAKQIANLEKELPSYEKLASDEKKLKTATSEKKKAEELVKGLIGKQKDCSDNKNKYEEDLSKLASVDVDAIRDEAREKELKQELSSVQGLQERLEKLSKLDENRKETWEEFLGLRKVYSELSDKFVSLNTMLINGRAGSLAAELKEGEPCPVCGSLIHPHPAEFSEEIPDAEEVERAKTVADEAREDMNAASNASTSAQTMYDKELEEIAAEAHDFFDEEVSLEDLPSLLKTKEDAIIAEQKETKKKRDDLVKSRKKQKSLKEKIRSLMEELEKLTSDKEEAENNLQTCGVAVASLSGTISSLKQTLSYASLKEAKKSLSSCREKLNEFDNLLKERKEDLAALNKKINEASGAFTVASEGLERNGAKLKKAEATFTKALETNGFASADEYRDNLQSENYIESDEEAVREYYEQLNTQQGAVKTLADSANGLVFVDVSSLEEKKGELVSQVSSKSELLTEVKKRLQMNASAVKKIQDAWGSSLDLIAERDAVQQISEIANGKLTTNKLDLERYILAVYFEEILRSANIRLKEMTSGRYTLKRSGNAKRANSHYGLDLEIIDGYNGLARGTETLSGGESFMAALSLALGLSDIIQMRSGGIQVDALFVDEGFDSLDTETLQEVLLVLQKLTVGDRIVGIISHVESLKEQMEKKIVVTKLGNGKSEVRVEV